MHDSDQQGSVLPGCSVLVLVLTAAAFLAPDRAINWTQIAVGGPTWTDTALYRIGYGLAGLLGGACLAALPFLAWKTMTRSGRGSPATASFNAFSYAVLVAWLTILLARLLLAR